MTVKMTMVKKGRTHGPGHADHRLLIAHGDIAPSEDREQLAIMPEIGPVVALGAPGSRII